MKTCPTCNSSNTQAGIDKFQCLGCGQLFTADGTAAEAGMDESTRKAFGSRMAPRQATVVGNLADLQRAGQAAVLDGATSLAAGVEVPPVAEGTALGTDETANTVEAGAKVVHGDKLTTTASASAEKPKAAAKEARKD